VYQFELKNQMKVVNYRQELTIIILVWLDILPVKDVLVFRDWRIVQYSDKSLFLVETASDHWILQLNSCSPRVGGRHASDESRWPRSQCGESQRLSMAIPLSRLVPPAGGGL